MDIVLYVFLYLIFVSIYIFFEKLLKFLKFLYFANNFAVMYIHFSVITMSIQFHNFLPNFRMRVGAMMDPIFCSQLKMNHLFAPLSSFQIKVGMHSIHYKGKVSVRNNLCIFFVCVPGCNRYFLSLFLTRSNNNIFFDFRRQCY